jgi:hypothetical protein
MISLRCAHFHCHEIVATFIEKVEVGVPVKNDGKKAVIFNMQGQKLNSVPAKGLYIMNNRKYVVK